MAGAMGWWFFKHRTSNTEHRTSNMGAAQRRPGVDLGSCAERVWGKA